MPNPQRFLRVALENALDLVGQGSKDPGELHFNTQSIVQDVNLRCRCRSKSHDPQIRRVAIPIGLAIGEFIDVIPAQEFYLLDDPPFRVFGTEAWGTVMTIEFDMTTSDARHVSIFALVASSHKG
jgi:hypothetical protein